MRNWFLLDALGFYPSHDEFAVKRRCLREFLSFPAEPDITASHGNGGAPVYAKMILSA
jgi:hypothetical protein